MDLGRKFEKKWSKLSKSKLTINSGTLWFSKEDTINDYWLYQCKATTKDYFSIRYEDIKQLKRNANKKGLNWAFVISFENHDCIYVLSDFYLCDEVIDYELKNTYIPVSVNKTKKFLLEDLQDNWLNDYNFLVNFPDKIKGIIMHYHEFEKVLRKVEKDG